MESGILFLSQIESTDTAVIHKAIYNNSTVAVKICNEEDSINNEVKIMRYLEHPNIIRYINHFIDSGRLHIMMEYCDFCLSDILLNPNEVPIPFFNTDESNLSVVSIAINVCRGLNYLHSLNIVHHDLKSDNILVNVDGEIKICDFGFSVFFGCEFFSGTLAWAAPEILFHKTRCTNKIDIYSYGVCLWQFYTREIPYEKLTSTKLVDRICGGERLFLDDSCPKFYKDLAYLCMSRDSTLRPNCAKILEILTNKN
jgi:serine/threonine protein kinase